MNLYDFPALGCEASSLNLTLFSKITPVFLVRVYWKKGYMFFVKDMVAFHVSSYGIRGGTPEKFYNNISSSLSRCCLAYWQNKEYSSYLRMFSNRIPNKFCNRTTVVRLNFKNNFKILVDLRNSKRKLTVAKEVDKGNGHSRISAHRSDLCPVLQ
jgi:hypothetical protein